MAARKAGGTDDAPNETIGARLRNLRKQRKLTLEQLSVRTAISVSSLSRIENTQLGLSIDKVRLLADALEIAPEDLITPGSASAPRQIAKWPAQTAVGRNRFAVDRARARTADSYREVRMEYMFDRDEERAIDCIHFVIQAISVWDSEFIRHPGEKILYVIRGEVIIYVEGRSPTILEAGDSLYMDSNVWHSVVAANGKPAEAVVTYYHGPDAHQGEFEVQAFTPEKWDALQA